MSNQERIAAYCRVSTDKDEQVSSLIAQQKFFEEYSEKNNCELVKLYTDEGKSGTKFKNRPAFRAMMEDAKLGIFDCVYVKDVSRLSRNVVDFLNSVRSLKAMGIDCRFITSNMSLSDGELTLTILAAVAQEESANLSKRVKFGKKKNAEHGKVPNFVFGYDKVDGDIFHMTINEAEAEIVRQIFHLYQRGYGTFKIAEFLNREGKTTKRGFPFSQNAVLRILKNRIYIGDIINGKEEVYDFLTGSRKKNKEDDWHIVKDAIPPIISTDTYLAVQNILEKKNENLPFQSVHTNHLFSTLITCKLCHSPFRLIVRKHKNVYRKWVCRARNQYGNSFCENKTVIDEEYLFCEVIRYLKTRLTNKELFFDHIAHQCETLYKNNENKKDKVSLIKRKSELEKLRIRKLSLFDAEILSLEELKKENDKIRNELAYIENEIIEINKENNSNAIHKIIADTINEEMLFSKEIFSNHILCEIIEKIEVDLEKATIQFKKI